MKVLGKMGEDPVVDIAAFLNIVIVIAELFQQVKTRFLGADVSQVSDPTRIQINLTGQAAGTFYVEMKGGHLAIEPYEYHDRDVEITVSDENFWKIVERKLDPVAAFTFGKLKAQGDLGKALELKKLIR